MMEIAGYVELLGLGSIGRRLWGESRIWNVSYIKLLSVYHRVIVTNVN